MSQARERARLCICTLNAALRMTQERIMGRSQKKNVALN